MVKPETGKKPVKTGENGSDPKPLYRQTGKTRFSSLPMKFTIIKKKYLFDSELANVISSPFG